MKISTQNSSSSLPVKFPVHGVRKDGQLALDVVQLQAEPEAETGGSTRIPGWKRAFDLTCVFLSAPCWVPLMMVIGVAIKVTSPGPIFFWQERVGYRGRRFMLVKFRSMKPNVETRIHEGYLERLIREDSPMTKLDTSGDPRLIPWGRFFRATCLDELPQIFNVIRGEMSLVGPRPGTPHEFDHYEAWQRKRVDAPPGLTGYWQVNGKNKTTFSQMITMDISYSKKMSLWLDISIILKTVPTIMTQLFEASKRNRADRQSMAEAVRRA